jgi:LacI family transcriptional regulator
MLKTLFTSALVSSARDAELPAHGCGGIVYSSHMAVKMKDIARDLGVSLVTVSKALRNHPDISKRTRERVNARVKELGYRPNLAARSLVTGRSSLIGLIVPDLVHPFFADVARGLSQVLRGHGYFLIISSSEEDPTLEQQEIEHMMAHRLDALVVATCQPNPDALRGVQQGGTPLILLDRYFDGFDSHFVGSDDYSAGKIATEHLLSIGCKRIAHIQGPDNSTGIRRLKGFLDTLRKHDISPPPEYIVKARSVDVDGKKHGADALKELFALRRPPDGVFCYNDVIATGVIVQAFAQNIAVPRDLAVIGCGNLHFDDSIRVPLSSVDQRSNEIGRRTGKLILELLAEDASQQARRIVLQANLAPRASTERETRPRARQKAAKP